MGDAPPAAPNQHLAEKRFACLSVGWLMAVIAVLVFCWQVYDFWSRPTYYDASVMISFDFKQRGASEAFDQLYGKPNLVYSRTILYPVVETANLNQRWGEKYGGGGFVLNSPMTYIILTNLIHVIHLKSAAPELMIVVSIDSKQESIELANEIAYSCRDHFNQNSTRPVLITETNKVSAWKVPFIRWLLPWSFSIQFVGLGILIIYWGRKMPRPPPVAQVPVGGPISKY